MFALALCLIVVVAVLQATVHAKSWAIDSNTAATTVLGSGLDGANFAVAAAAFSGVGAFAELFNGTHWSKTQVQGGTLLDAATSRTGLVVTSSLSTIFVSNDFGVTFGAVPGIVGVSQSVSIFGANNDKVGVVGGFLVTPPDSKIPQSLYGVAYSLDNGATWGISSNMPVTYARYGAFPTDTTWYVSSGIWPTSEQGQFSSRVSLGSAGKGLTINREPLLSKKSKSVRSAETTRYFGAVSKTTDGGKTWTEVFHSNENEDYFYFNGIACPSEQHCVVVGEGEDGLGGYLTVAYTTFDGGASWDRTISSGDMVSMIGVDFISENEAWAVGTKKKGLSLVAQFHHTLDGGKTFTVDETLTNCLALDLDFSADGFAIASCASSSGGSCSAALYR